MKKIVLYVVFLVITAFGCEDNLQEPVPVDFEFRLLNEQGQPSTTFKEGENFVFSFLVINKSNETWYLRAFYSEDFFRVYKIDNTETDTLLDLGRPYKGMFCLEVGGIPILSRDTLRIETKWTVPENSWQNQGEIFCFGNNSKALLPGEYITFLKNTFVFFKGDKSFETDALNLSIDFIVN